MDASIDGDLDERLSLDVKPHPPGTCLSEDLVVTGILGEGGTAIVYSALHRVLEREVAVKVSMGASAACRERLIREAKMCAAVRDPHIPRVYGLGYLRDGSPYMIMERVAGTVLTQTLSRFRVPVRVACEIACELLETLDSVHFAGLIHRDIKPSNLVIDLRPSASVQLHLLDFGVGKILRTADADWAVLTCQGELLGTPLYMAPEQILTLPVDERADIYATGALLYEMLVGHAPFQGESIGEVFAAVLRDEPMPLRTLRPELPLALERVVLRAMDRNPDVRFQSAYAMRVALLQALYEVLSLGLPEAFEAKATALGCIANDVPTIPMPSRVDALHPEEPETDDHERTSGPRLRPHVDRTLSYLRTFPIARERSRD